MGALEGKVAIVAGGGTGIGRATAQRFAAEGARVVVSGRRPAPLEEVVQAIAAAGGRATAVPGDVAEEADVARLVVTAQREHGATDGNHPFARDVQNAVHDTPPAPRRSPNSAPVCPGG